MISMVRGWKCGITKWSHDQKNWGLKTWVVLLLKILSEIWNCTNKDVYMTKNKSKGRPFRQYTQHWTVRQSVHNVQKTSNLFHNNTYFCINRQRYVSKIYSNYSLLSRGFHPPYWLLNPTYNSQEYIQYQGCLYRF